LAKTADHPRQPADRRPGNRADLYRTHGGLLSFFDADPGDDVIGILPP
jgi:hypothetical protein